MKKIAYISLSLAMSFSLAACSSANAGTDKKLNEKNLKEDVLVDDLEKVDFMDENFDMSKIDQHSCCDE